MQDMVNSKMEEVMIMEVEQLCKGMPGPSLLVRVVYRGRRVALYGHISYMI